MLCNNGQSVIENAVSNKRRIEESFHLSNENRKYAVAAFELIKRGFKVVSGGTDDHLFLVDFIEKGITGKDVDAALGRANITVNKNSVPNDPQSPFVTSGIRVGTPAPTTRGFKEAECIELTNWMCDVIENLDNEEVINAVKQKVIKLCKKYPVYAKSVALNAASAA